MQNSVTLLMLLDGNTMVLQFLVYLTLNLTLVSIYFSASP